MPNATFRIESVSIEGFKAFTKQQTFHFEGRHVFLFGPNGLGKTSIVEAIRWCLFGLASRPGEIVKNQFYQGPCIVQMTLGAPDGQWTMQRRLRPSGGESDRTVRDPSGSERNLEDVFPQLSRIGPREGTHVIYAAQQPSSRRPEADITDFSYVVYRYLGLEEVPRLSDVLLSQSKDWKIQEDEMCAAVETLGDTFSQRIAGVDESLGRITSDPPWGAGITPTNADTRDKIDQLARDAMELGADCSSEALDGLSPQDKLYELDTAIHSFLSGELAGLTERLAKKSDELGDGQSRLETAQSATHKIRDESNIRDTLKTELDSALKGLPLEELEIQLQEAEADFETTQLKLDVVRSSRKYLDAIGDGIPHDVCPTCEGGIALSDLKSQLEGSETSGDDKTDEILEQRDQLRERITSAKQLSERIEEIETDIDRNKKDLAETLEQAEQAFGIPSPASIELLGKYVEEVRKGHQNLRSALASQSEALKVWDGQIGNARQEIRFHQLRTLKERLQRLYDVRYEAIHSSLKDLVDLRTSRTKLGVSLTPTFKNGSSRTFPR